MKRLLQLITQRRGKSLPWGSGRRQLFMAGILGYQLSPVLLNSQLGWEKET